MGEKTKNAIIIILSVLLFISFVFNVISFKPMMHANMQRDMIQRQMPNHFNNMPYDKNNQVPNNNQKPNDSQNNENNEQDQDIR